MNNSNIHLIFPMSGQGVRFQKAGYKDPKPLICVNNSPMIVRLLNAFPGEWTCTFVLADNHKDTALPDTLRNLRSDAQIFFIPPHKQGPITPIIKALESIKEDQPILISYCDYGMIWDAHHFRDFVFSTDCDACVISYKGFHAHYHTQTPYAYSLLNEYGQVVKIKEKGWFTQNREDEYASCGAYYFKNKKILNEAIKFQIDNDMQLNGEFYTSLTIEALVQTVPNVDIRIYEIPYFFQWGTPCDLESFTYWEKSYQAHFKWVSTNKLAPVDQIVIPMAGFGSRFKDVTSLPKPLIPVNGRPMYKRALQTLPPSKKTICVTLKEITQDLPSDNIEYVSLEKTPEGQALSVAAAQSALNQEQNVLISSCDHGVVINPNLWQDFSDLNEVDALIFTMKNFPGVKGAENSYAYVVSDSTDKFPNVTHVSVKKPISSTPWKDDVLVGTFWFKKAKILTQGIEWLVSKNIRVNNELYLDSIFEGLLEMGYKVHKFSLDGYLCWGDPSMLAQALYWQDVFSGHSILKRPKFPGVQ